VNPILKKLRDYALVTSSLVPMFAAQIAAAEPLAPNDTNTTTPIKHVIVIIGENRTFDHVFATYQPKAGQTVFNLLSEKIVTAEGKPGVNFSKVAKFNQPVQNDASDTTTYELAPGGKKAYKTLPPPGASGAPTAALDTDPPPFKTLEAAANYEYGLFPGDLKLITTGATGLSSTHAPDTRITNDAKLPDGPFQLTGAKLPYDSYTGSPVHRFYQMWQQEDCSTAHATTANPTGCLGDLFPYVETTIDTGNNGAKPPAGYNPATYQSAEGATSMAFFNMAAGDVPYLKELADHYTISDNFHQSVMGGTGANHLEFGYADGLYYSDAKGAPAKPPAGQIENPNPQKGTNNYWVNDGYGSSTTGDGGSYSNCADTAQNGVKAVVAYLKTINVKPNCEANAYYLLNNYNPGYVGNGTTDPTVTGPFTIPPVTKKHIGDDLTAGQVSWEYFGESWNDYVVDPNGATNPAGYLYCNICNPFAYQTNTMTGVDPKTGLREREEHIADTTQLYTDIANGDLPAVSIVKPNALNDGHPASSKLDLFESFTKKIITQLQANKALWATTAVFITWDEGGGYWDSGYVQPVDFFGDGTRIPLITVSPFATGGKVLHNYSDHVSIDKFIEKNWKLKPITTRSRDNLPNPKATASNPYVPTNRPAISDLTEMFTFPK
jgi:phospholipase C